MSIVRNAGIALLALHLPLAAEAQGRGAIHIDGLRNARATVARYWITASQQLTDAQYAYRPVASVRSVGGLIAHIVDAERAICAGLRGDAPRPPQVERSGLLTKVSLQPLLAETMEYCVSAYAAVSDAALADTVEYFGSPVSRLQAMTSSIAHLNEHYGNIVTYMRLLGLVPPSSLPAGGEDLG